MLKAISVLVIVTVVSLDSSLAGIPFVNDDLISSLGNIQILGQSSSAAHSSSQIASATSQTSSQSSSQSASEISPISSQSSSFSGASQNSALSSLSQSASQSAYETSQSSSESSISSKVPQSSLDSSQSSSQGIQSQSSSQSLSKSSSSSIASENSSQSSSESSSQSSLGGSSQVVSQSSAQSSSESSQSSLATSQSSSQSSPQSSSQISSDCENKEKHKCPKDQKCSANEEYVPCPATVCIPKRCSDLGFPLKCPKKNPDGSCPGKPGCICKTGYLRDNNGKCVPEIQCPSCGGDNNAQPGCGINCGKLCSDVGKSKPQVCPLGCILNGCDCKDGYYFDSKIKKCVGPNECSNPKCFANEEYVPCPATVCIPKRCSDLGFPLKCPKKNPDGSCPGKPGCICKTGYLRDNNGKCVPESQCPSCGGDNNAQPGCGINCGKLCSDVGKSKPQVCPLGCILNGCDCKDGYYFDSKIKKCVGPNECSNQKCSANEEYVPCPATVCIPKRCSDLGFPLKCPKKNPDGSCPGKPGCICKTGYLRDNNGKCVPESQCPSCGGDNNAQPGCGINCGKLCSDVGKSKPLVCPLGCILNGCDCKDGYYFDSKIKKCVGPNECSNQKCSANEEYVPCPATVCIPKRCSDLGFPLKCPKKNPDGSCPGKPGCICKTGYLRDNNGKCVPESQCPSCGGDNNAQPGCGINCGKLCSDVGKSKPQVCPLGCILNGCDCKDGYYFDSKIKKCVGPNECSNPKCFANEEYVPCPATVCIPKRCSDLGFPLECPKKNPDGSCPGKPGCICKTGYLRDNNGKCVPESQCPSCGGDNNAQPGCGINCGKLCSDVGKSKPLVCPLGCILNGCDCKDGYYFDSKIKKCVGPNECSNQKCSANEEYVPCPATVCIPKRCSDLGFPLKCPKKNPDGSCPGKPGCICKTGYLRDNNGKCVPESQCPSCGGDNNAQPGCGINCGKLCSDVGKSKPQVCPLGCILNGCDCKDGYYFDSKIKKCVGPNECSNPKCFANEEYVPCPATVCIPKRCSDLGFPLECPKKNPDGSCPGKPGCICKTGYLRDNNGKCVPESQCPSCGGDNNAQPGCGINCGKLCSDVGKSKPLVCPHGCILNGCDCKDGYYFDSKIKKCVGPNECSNQKCSANEEYVPCPATVCIPKRCSDLGFPLKCPKKNPDGSCPGKPGCICKTGYLRDNNGKCVPESQCPSCGGDNNAQPGCGINCGKLCSDVGKSKPLVCPLGCILNGCDCKDGYYFDSKIKKCVGPNECSNQKCSANEEYVPCPATVCIPNRCSDLGFPLKCPKKNPDGSCPGKPGCICKTGYLRDNNGKCVPESQCPSCGGDNNAQPGCGINCGKLCSDVGKSKPQVCPLGCILNGCDCKDGYYFDSKIKKCVGPNECSNPKCFANEEYVPCPATVCIPKRCSDLGFPLECPKKNPDGSCPGKPGCICKTGYLRDNNGKCVPESQCPSCGGDNNAQPGCGINCGKLCSDVGKSKPLVCPLGCILNGCDCKDGYYFDSKIKKCVGPNECSNQKCSANEEYVPCPATVCIPKRCSDLGFPLKCPKKNPDGSCPGKPGCICKTGYLRDNNGKCVPESQCPSCGGDNNAQPGCGINCGKLCSDVGKSKPLVCPLGCILNGCDCKDGYYFDSKIKKCVGPNECSNQKCSANEEYVPCPATVCIPKRCSDLGFPLKCPKKNPDGSCPGKPGCICKTGYLRDNNGKCVPESQCPSCGGDNNAQPGCGINCGKLCSDVGKSKPQVCPLGCILNGCDCKDGYYFDSKIKKCVGPNECSNPKCFANEEYVPCPATVCIPKRCSDLGFPLKCPKKNPDGSCPGKPGCICKTGYLRDNNGKCVPESQCPSCGGDNNAQPGCGINCGKLCSDVGKSKPLVCPLGCILNGCDCKDGYYFDSKIKKCVGPNECSNQKCSVNEEYVPCPATVCIPKRCSDLGFPLKCPKKNPDGSCPGKPGCICKTGYLRDNNGKCVPESQCPSCGGDNNAQPGCGINCGKLCSDVGKSKPLVCPLGCILNGCDCKDGYYFDSKIKKCVGPNECSNQKCSVNEEYVPCPATVCIPKRCSDLGFPLKCPKKNPDGSCPGKPGCICKTGYLRDNNGKCVPESQCPSCGGDNNAQPGCGINCGKLCSDVGKSKPQVCPLGCILNGCDCKDGYYFDSKIKKCVGPNECSNPKCFANEEYVPCPATVCIPKRCSDLGFPLECPKKNPDGSCPGKPGCICKTGYLRDNNGKCVPESQCPSCGGDNNAQPGCGINCGKLCSDVGKSKPQVCPLGCILNGCDCKDGYYFDSKIKKCVVPNECSNPKCSANEEYVPCPATVCIPKRCSDLGFPLKCPKKNPDGSCPGKPGCICKTGYLRDNNGKCVPKSQCPSCGGDNNAQPGCGLNCGKLCSDVGKSKPQVCPLGCILNGCDCKDGYYFDSKIKKCVGPNECSNPKCSANEEYVPCPATVCIPKRCSDLGFPLKCPKKNPDGSCPGKPGCICKAGYLRDSNGKCVPEKLCPSCGGDKNAKPGCGNNCGKKCSDVGKSKPDKCPIGCIYNGCDCKDGFYYDSKVKKCGRPNECSTKCSENEIYEKRPPQCKPRTCADLKRPSKCPKKKCHVKIHVKPGCVCKPGFLRNQKGKCIPKCDSNE